MAKRISEQDARKAIADVKHPAIDCTLVELGIVKDIKVKDGKVVVTIAFPVPDIPIRDMIINSVKEPIANLGVECEIEETIMTPKEREAFLDKEGKILIVKRNLKSGINKWALPGGFVESNEIPEIACLRELQEETGLKGKIKRLIGAYIQKTREYGSLLVIGYEVNISRNYLSLNSELKDAKFFSKKNMPFMPFSSHRRMIKRI